MLRVHIHGSTRAAWVLVPELDACGTPACSCSSPGVDAAAGSGAGSGCKVGEAVDDDGGTVATTAGVYNTE